MRRSSSEGSLLDPDVPLWRRHQLKEPPFHLMESDALRRPPEHSDTSTCASLPPIILELGSSPGGRLAREHSVSVEDLKELNKRDMDYLGVGTISEGLRAYSEGQLSQPSKGDGTQGEDRTDHLPPHSTRADVSFKSHHHRLHARAKLSAAKLHIKGLFGQSYYPSNPTLSQEDQKDSVKEKRSRLLFMRQWSQVGHGRGLTFSGEELQKWGQSLNTLLASRGFLRSEFSEENLQFYLACEQYRQSSNNFSLQRRAKEICTTYIQPGSPREVNLDSKTRALTLQTLQAPSHTSLLQAQKLIYGLLDTDCYPRFLQSSLFHSLQQGAR